jgi:tetratricopeptide (TPR) repeat protein
MWSDALPEDPVAGSIPDVVSSHGSNGFYRGFCRARLRGMSREVGLCALLVALTMAVYAQVGRCGFIPIDDRLYVTNEAHIRNGLTLHGIGWAFGNFYDCNWIPLTWISLMLDATAYGTWPGGYHLTNVLLHVANVLLVFTLFARATGNRSRSAFVAALFAVHPLHVESVAWIAERKDVLSVLFGLLSLHAYVSYARHRRIAQFGVALAFFLCSLLSKQTLVTLPFVLLLLDFWPLGRLQGGPAPRLGSRHQHGIAFLLVEKLPFVILSGAFCAVLLLAQARGHSTRSLVEFPLWTRCLNAVLVYGLYLKKALLPIDLVVFYPHPGRGLGLVAVGLSFACLTAITAFTIANARRWPYLLVGWLWYLGTLVPMIGVVQVGLQQMADRYTYFPLLGVYAAVAWLVPALLRKSLARGRLLPMAAVGVVGVYATIALVQIGYWHNGVTLMRRTLAMTEDNSFAHFLLGKALYTESQIDEAIEEFRYAIRLTPDDPEGYSRLGWVFQGLKKYDEAAQQYRASLAVDESIVVTHNRLGWIHWAQRKHVEARCEFERAIELDPQDVEAYMNLAGLARSLGDYWESNAYCQRALEIDQSLFDCRRLMAFNLRDVGRLDEAVDQLRGVLAVSPADSEARSELAHVLALKGDRPHAE